MEMSVAWDRGEETVGTYKKGYHYYGLLDMYLEGVPSITHAPHGQHNGTVYSHHYNSLHSEKGEQGGDKHLKNDDTHSSITCIV